MKSVGLDILLEVIRDLLPIGLILAAFQGLVLRRPLRRAPQVALGVALLILGLALVLYGLENTVFPLGRQVAAGLAESLAGNSQIGLMRLFLFLATLGFAAALAEPVLTAVAHRAAQLSGGTINPWGLRLAVALGIGLGACLGLARMLLGLPLFPLLASLFAILWWQARLTPKTMVNLALDSGVVTISTLTAPLLVAVGIGVATQLGGMSGSSTTDGFGLLAVTAAGPALTVMLYAQLAHRRGSTTS